MDTPWGAHDRFALQANEGCHVTTGGVLECPGTDTTQYSCQEMLFLSTAHSGNNSGDEFIVFSIPSAQASWDDHVFVVYEFEDS